SLAIRLHRARQVGEVRADEEEARGAVAEDAGQLGRGEPDVERGEDRAELAAGEEQVEVLDAVEGEDRDAVAAADPHAAQGVGEAGGAGVELRPDVAPAAIPVEERLALGRQQRPPSNPIADEHRSALSCYQGPDSTVQATIPPVTHYALRSGSIPRAINEVAVSTASAGGRRPSQRG